jgi:hypothetical protein
MYDSKPFRRLYAMNSFWTISRVNMEPGELSRYSNWLGLNDWGGWSSSPGRVKNFLFSKFSRPALGSTQPPIQWVPGVKRPGRETDHSFPANAEVEENEDLYIHSPIRLHGVMLNLLSAGTTLPFTFLEKRGHLIFVFVKIKMKMIMIFVKIITSIFKALNFECIISYSTAFVSSCLQPSELNYMFSFVKKKKTFLWFSRSKIGDRLIFGIYDDDDDDDNVTCRPFVGQRPRDKLIHNIRYWVTASQTNMLPRQQLNYNNAERCFLCGSCGDVINGTSWELKWLSEEGSQSRRTVKYGHESHGPRNQQSLCWRGPATI